MTTVDIEKNQPEPKPVAFRAEVRQLLDILAHSLYTDREVFLRELISNASDALHRVEFEMLTNREILDPEAELCIRISFDKEAKTLTIKDSGIGMTETEIIENLGTIAQSGARAFLQQASEDKQSRSNIIGQFGVGFYSVFMVADRVTVTSRSYRPEAQATLWEATSGDTFTVAVGEQAERGTTMVLHLKDDAAEFANEWRIEQIIKHHSNFVAFPIYIEEKRVNEQQALWRRMPRDVQAEQYLAFYKQLTFDMEEPLLHFHLNTDVPVDLHAILFVPSKRERGLIERRIEGNVKLYSRKVLIQQECKDLLPVYFRFIEGVVDSEDIPLNVSRETTQNSPVMQRIRKALTTRLLRELADLTEDKTKFAKFWDQFGMFIKDGVATDYENRDELVKLLRFVTTHSDGQLATLAECKERMITDQKEFYYVLANNVEAAQHSPHLDPLKERGIEVLFFTDIMDSFMLTSLTEFEGFKLRNIDDANLELPGSTSEAASLVSDEDFAQLCACFKSVLGERVTEVKASKVLRSSPARLSANENVPGREAQRIQHLLGQETKIAPRILELNRAHPLIANLTQRAVADADAPLVAASAEQLYDNALLLEGLHPNPATMVPRIQAILEAACKEISLPGSQ